MFMPTEMIVMAAMGIALLLVASVWVDLYTWESR